MTIYVPLLLTVDTDSLREAQEAAEIYTEGTVDGESTKLRRPVHEGALSPMVRSGETVSWSVPSDWD